MTEKNKKQKMTPNIEIGYWKVREKEKEREKRRTALVDLISHTPRRDPSDPSKKEIPSVQRTFTGGPFPTITVVGAHVL